ncbi:MAG: ferrochelatase [Gammaproteobacteria bacterium]|nr:ferrochelatase [Gammaproteobacteria bacterium]
MKIGILLINLGTPNAPTARAVRRYLREFLSDPRVIEVPRLIWWFILNGIILNIRPFKSAKLYQAIWTEQGSPLLIESQKQKEALQAALGEGFIVKLGMRYGSPSIQSALAELQKEGVQKIIALPLYPQYSAATTASTFDAIAQVFSKWRALPEFHFIRDYHQHPLYIEALAQQIRSFWTTHPKPDCLLFSFHGLPEKCVQKGDPYAKQCFKTAHLVAKALGLSELEWRVSFQSRVGFARWLQPYTSECLKEWGEHRLDTVHVTCPGFSADCLETLEEIAVQNREVFLSHGGKHFEYIPALNDSKNHIELLKRLVLSGTEA